MNQASALAAARLSPDTPETWLDDGFEALYAMSWRDYEEVQLAALKKRFDHLSREVAALDKLARREGISSIDRLEDVLPVLFDHRVYKSYPISIIEKRDIGKLQISECQRLIRAACRQDHFKMRRRIEHRRHDPAQSGVVLDIDDASRTHGDIVA